MTWTGDLFMGPDSHESSEPRLRLARYLRGKFPAHEGYPAKRLSKAIGCTPKVAENVLDGHWPNSRNWARIAALFGRDVLDIVFGPDINATVERLRQEEVRLERQLLETRARRLETEGAFARAEERAEAAAAQTLVELHHRENKPRKTGG